MTKARKIAYTVAKPEFSLGLAVSSSCPDFVANSIDLITVITDWDKSKTGNFLRTFGTIVTFSQKAVVAQIEAYQETISRSTEKSVIDAFTGYIDKLEMISIGNLNHLIHSGYRATVEKKLKTLSSEVLITVGQDVFRLTEEMRTKLLPVLGPESAKILNELDLDTEVVVIDEEVEEE